MQKFFALLLSVVVAASAFSQVRDAGVVVTKSEGNTLGVVVHGSTQELQNLAAIAFDAHGAFRRVASGGAYTVNFEAAGANRVTVTVSRGSGVVHTETVSGESTRNALLRAADVAVNRMTGLPGFFAGKLAFVADHGGQQTIMTGDLFFGEVQSYPVQGKQIIGPRWAPDGSRIIFTSYRTGFPDIYTLDMRTRQMSVFISVKGTNSGARFSPDGSRVAMVLSGEGNPEIYLANGTGRIQKRLTNNPSVEASPVWSPDGSRLAFTSDAMGGPQIHLVSAAGGSMQRVATNISRYCAEPDWSAAKPNRLVFTAGVGRGYQIAVFELGSSEARIVTKAPNDAVEPVWLADGRHVVCTFRSANSRALYLVDTESDRVTRISPAALGSAWNASYLMRR